MKIYINHLIIFIIIFVNNLCNIRQDTKYNDLIKYNESWSGKPNNFKIKPFNYYYFNYHGVYNNAWNKNILNKLQSQKKCQKLSQLGSDGDLIQVTVYMLWAYTCGSYRCYDKTHQELEIIYSKFGNYLKKKENY